MILKFTYLMCLMCMQTIGVSIDMATEIAAALNTQFYIDGAYLLKFPHQQDEVWWTEVGRELVRRNVPTAVMKFENAVNIHVGLLWFPICIMYSQGMDTIPALQEFSSIPNADLPLWLLFLDKDLSMDYFFEDVYIPFNCRFVVAQPEEDSVHLTEVYRITPEHVLSKLQLGVWTNESLTLYKNNLYEGRGDLQGHRMRAIIINSMPYSTMYEVNGTVIIKGSIPRLWRLMEIKLNFTTEYILSEDGFSGIMMSDGTWSGFIGRLQRQESDVAITATSMTPGRATAVDFSSPIFITSYRAFIKKPGFLQFDWSNFWSPFDVSLWITVLIIIFSVSVMVEACHRLIRRFGDGCHETQHQPFFVESLFYVFGAFCNQGQDMTSRFMSIRTSFLVVHLTAVVLIAAYSACLISTLTIETQNLPFSDFNELLEDGSYMVGVTNRSSGIGMFQFSGDPSMREIYSKFMEPDPENFPNTTLAGLQRVCTKRFAFVAQIARVQALADLVSCQIVDVPGTSIDVDLAIAFSKGNPYRGIINYHLQVMRTSGILKKLEAEEPIDHNLGVKSELQSLKLGDTAPLLIVWFLSIVVGISLLILERKARHLMARRLYKPELSEFQVA